MLHHAFGEHQRGNSVTWLYKKVDLHADNCGGQKKNRYIMWYLLWPICQGYEEEIYLQFLVADHTKIDATPSLDLYSDVSSNLRPSVGGT